ncbi:WD40 repeat-like protein [Pleurostoma richardsiae]|uniref:WD40 repeat-like protein n=1 Tax=Pleurostoma richardsiae TaxID=41990 RepID=A0AA38RHM8_9PEZI|nr:WD40 repeat-like protein [Pleurostoma richardsiae]
MLSSLKAPLRGPVEIIDLTVDDDDDDEVGGHAPAATPGAVSSNASFADSEPPRKKFKPASTQDFSDPSFKQALVLCVQRQVSPYIRQHLAKIKDSLLDKHKLSSDILHRVTTAELVSDFKLHNHSISSDYEHVVALRVEGLVRELVRAPEYRLKSYQEYLDFSPLTFDDSSPERKVTRQIKHEDESLGASRQQAWTNGLGAQQSNHVNGNKDKGEQWPPPESALAPAAAVHSLAERKRHVDADANGRHPESESHPESGPEDAPPAALHPAPQTPIAVRTRTAIPPTTPKNFRSRARDLALKSSRSRRPEDGESNGNQWFTLERRPYMRAQERDEIVHASRKLMELGGDVLKQPHVFHVDFSPYEVRELLQCVERSFDSDPVEEEEPTRRIAKILKKHRRSLPSVLEKLADDKRKFVEEKEWKLQEKKRLFAEQREMNETWKRLREEKQKWEQGGQKMALAQMRSIRKETKRLIEERKKLLAERKKNAKGARKQAQDKGTRDNDDSEQADHWNEIDDTDDDQWPDIQNVVDPEDLGEIEDTEDIVLGRELVDIENFLVDTFAHRTSMRPQLLSCGRDDYDKHEENLRSSSLSSLLLARSITGQNALRDSRRLVNYSNEFRKCREDGLERRVEWTGGAGDIATISWVSNEGFICGTTTHSDFHNQQYNKPGNLLLGSATLGKLCAYADHRVVRPIVSKGDNASEAMRESQDPWLYSSVVSSDYDPVHDRAYTSSFDKTVKAWRVDKSGNSMVLLGTWKHRGNVNFVEAAKHHTGIVATAADVPTGAVRVYKVDENDISNSPYYSLSCSRVLDLEGNPIVTDKWAYFPATMKWGLAKQVRNLLLVGYSPRSLTNDDNDIPEDKRNSGEICLWDGLTGERVKVTSASTQNVFEVLWHPSQPSFIVATSPLKPGFEDRIRTQIRIFRPSDNPDFGHAYSEIQTLDCEALDINELTIMPNSASYSYITAGCTDGKVYVWDTASGDKPIHVLKHGEPHEDIYGDREMEDVGVKFTAWGTTPDRLYTGSSDGVVKVWNVRSHRKPLIRDLLEVPAQVSFGAFSPDKSRLVIGDASGRVFLLSVDDSTEYPAAFVKVSTPDGVKTVRRPIDLEPHPTPDPPTHDEEGNAIMRDVGPTDPTFLLNSGRVKLHPDPTIGAVKGPKYAETGLFRNEAHVDDDPNQPLTFPFVTLQQEVLKSHSGRRRCLRMRDIRQTDETRALHEANQACELEEEARNLRLESLEPETRAELLAERVELDFDGVYSGLVYETDDDTLA